MSKVKLTLANGEVYETESFSVEAVPCPEVPVGSPPEEVAGPEEVFLNLEDYYRFQAYRVPVKDNTVHYCRFTHHGGKRNFRSSIMSGMMLFTPQGQSRAPIEMAVFKMNPDGSPGDLVQEDIAGQVRIPELAAGDYVLVLDIIDQKDREWESTLVFYK